MSRDTTRTPLSEVEVGTVNDAGPAACAGQVASVDTAMKNAIATRPPWRETL